MAAADDGALHRLVQTDFDRRCRTAFFCFRCAAPICGHCCPGNHSQLHHGGGRAPVLVDTIRYAPAVRSMDAVGCGYNTAGIQRFCNNREKWIPILRQQHVDHRLHKPCAHCEQSVASSATYCSFACRAEDHQGYGFAMVQQLVEFAQHYSEPFLQVDRFCTICFRAFSSTSCPNHTVHHNGAQAAAAEAETVIRVRVIDGWAAVEEAQLPGHFVQNVQQLHQDGRTYYPGGVWLLQFLLLRLIPVSGSTAPSPLSAMKTFVRFDVYITISYLEEPYAS